MRTILWLFLSLILVGAGLTLRAGESLPEWTQEVSRTQGGGYIWFPGKGTAYTEIEAEDLARGQSLDYLVQECQILHKEIRFNERFVEQVEKKFVVYVRASITQKQCNEAKYATLEFRKKISNRRLLDTYHNYKVTIAEEAVAHVQCTYQDAYCGEFGVQQIYLNNLYLALAYFKKACAIGLPTGCESIQQVLEEISVTN